MESPFETLQSLLKRLGRLDAAQIAALRNHLDAVLLILEHSDSLGVDLDELDRLVAHLDIGLLQARIDSCIALLDDLNPAWRARIPAGYPLVKPLRSVAYYLRVDLQRKLARRLDGASTSARTTRLSEANLVLMGLELSEADRRLFASPEIAAHFLAHVWAEQIRQHKSHPAPLPADDVGPAPCPAHLALRPGQGP